MRIARVGCVFAIGAALALVIPGAAPAATSAPPSFKVTISPEYATAGQPTTFQVTIVNTSPSGTTLGSASLTPPPRFTPPKPAAGKRLQTSTKLQNHTLSLPHVELKPGSAARLSITTTAPGKCGRTRLHWSAKGFAGASRSGPQLALQTALSSLGVTVLCPSTAVCGDGGPPCSTNLITSESTYAVVSDASAGTLRQTVNVGHQLNCGTYRFRDSNWYDSVVVPPASSPPTATSVPIIDNISYKIRNATAKGIGFCLGASYDFTTAAGSQAAAGQLPNGNPGFIGMLPRCSQSKPPCIAGVKQTPDHAAKVGFDVNMKIQIPETGDPWGHS
jgi:hypothetical protein